MALNGKFIICIEIILAVASGLDLCGGFQKSDGYTVPQGDIILRYGEPLNITCNLHEYMVASYGQNASSRLYFTKNDAVLPLSMIDVLNSTSIRLYIANHMKADQLNYYCWFWNGSMDNFTIEAGPHKSSLKRKGICLNVVSVGVPPQNITDFSCLSRNYENLTCTWTPEMNYIKTEYNLTYYLKLRAARNNKKLKRPDTVESNDPFPYNCPQITTSNGKMSCFWNVSTEPQYRQPHATYYFRLKMNNSFGSNENSFTFNHFKRVLPNPPENLTAVATSPHSIYLSWKIPYHMHNFPKGLQHRILYQCEYENSWKSGGILTDNKTGIKHQEFELRNLKYAHALCDIRVSMRSKEADDSDESMWSQNATTTVRLQNKIPDCPPKTNIGSFEIVGMQHSNHHDKRDVYVYWQDLREEQKNGENFSYRVEVENHPLLLPVSIKSTYALFSNLSGVEYVVNIWSANEMGLSENKSTVIIPAKALRKPLDFVKIEDYKNNLYEVQWEHPVESESVITNYTIFWCSNERDRPYQCDGYLNWTTVPKDVVKHNQTLPKKGIYQFAISANSHNSSSGMNWADCTAIANNKYIDKMKYVGVKRVGSDFIEVDWKLDCKYRNVGPISGFIIYYCQIDSSVRNVCIGSEKNVTFKGDANLISGKITGLKPYTSYRLTVSLCVNHSTYSEPSDPLFNVTNEAAPSTPPQYVTVFNKTNSTISLKWQTPAVKNGMLKKYLVYYNNIEKTVEPEKTEITLTDLISYENYSITIKACTVECSKASVPINVTTKMWLPGKINKPEISFPNDTHITFEWDRPRPPRGKTDYYQVVVNDKYLSENKDSLPYENVTVRNFSIENCKSGKYNTIFVAVRAVNIIDGQHKAGPWSDSRDFPCQSQYTSVIYISVGVAIILVAIAVTCCFKRAYISIKDMKNIDVELPPGLHQKVNTTDSMKSMNKIGADEELLLNKKMGGLRSSGDSSGCSSGHESITSSLESTTHISPSDSGTEQPRSPPLSLERKHSLRQRNVPAGMRPTTNKGYVLPDAIPKTNSPKPSPATGGSYCVLGVDLSSQKETDPPSIPTSDVSSKMQLPFSCDSSHPPPYVVTSDFIKTSNPGYVPYPEAEPAHKNSGYVVTALGKDLATPDLLQCNTSRPTSMEMKPLHVKAVEAVPNLKGIQFPWRQQSVEPAMPKTGYVTVGDAPPPKTVADVAKGYVPHRQFEAKSLKED